MEPNSHYSPGLWLDKATAGIRFKPDRAAVRAELSAHLEDKALDFQRIFPGLTEGEAQARAASEMGDPVEESVWTYAAEIPFSSQGPVQAGSYTLQVKGVLQLEEGHDVGGLALTWSAFSPLVWEEPTSHLYWRAEDDLGNTYFSHADLGMAIYVAGTYRYVSETTWERSGLGWTGRSQVWNVPRDAQWVRLILDFDEEPITILLEREEGAP